MSAEGRQARAVRDELRPGVVRNSGISFLGSPSHAHRTPAIDDYAEQRAGQIEYWTSQNGKQSGDPAKLAEALLRVASERPPRHRFLPGAIGAAEQKAAALQADVDLNHERFISLDVDET